MNQIICIITVSEDVDPDDLDSVAEHLKEVLMEDASVDDVMMGVVKP